MKKDFYVICDNIRSLENIGSIFRTADGLGVSKIFLCGISGSSSTNFGSKGKWKNINSKLYSKLVEDKSPHHKISKTALGAEKTIPFEYCKQTGRLIDRFKKDKINIIALEQSEGAIDYRKFRPKFPLALIIGNEVKGISKNILSKTDKIIYLPMYGKKESLNVSVAFGAAGYEIIKHCYNL